VIEFDDRDADDELRFNAIGMVDGRILFVTYTIRGSVIYDKRIRHPHHFRQRGRAA